MVLTRLSVVARKFSTSAARAGGHGGIAGENLPFALGNRYKFTAIMLVYLSSGFGMPFIMLRHHLKKK